MIDLERLKSRLRSLESVLSNGWRDDPELTLTIADVVVELTRQFIASQEEPNNGEEGNNSHIGSQ